MELFVPGAFIRLGAECRARVVAVAVGDDFPIYLEAERRDTRGDMARASEEPDGRLDAAPTKRTNA